MDVTCFSAHVRQCGQACTTLFLKNFFLMKLAFLTRILMVVLHGSTRNIDFPRNTYCQFSWQHRIVFLKLIKKLSTCCRTQCCAENRFPVTCYTGINFPRYGVARKIVVASWPRVTPPLTSWKPWGLLHSSWSDNLISYMYLVRTYLKSISMWAYTNSWTEVPNTLK